MARYFMQLRGGFDELLDPDGSEFPDLAAVRDAVLLTARDLIATDVRLGLMDFRSRIDAEDEGDAIVHTLRLKHTLKIMTGVPSSRGRRAVGPPFYVRNKTHLRVEFGCPAIATENANGRVLIGSWGPEADGLLPERASGEQTFPPGTARTISNALPNSGARYICSTDACEKILDRAPCI